VKSFLLRTRTKCDLLIGHEACEPSCDAGVFGALSGQSVPDTKNWTAADDHQNMMAQLGIQALRPGPSGNESAPNHANYDEAHGESVSRSAGRPDLKERQEGDRRRQMVEGAPA